MDSRLQPASPSFVERLDASLEQARTLEDLVRPLLDMLADATGLETTYLTRIDEAAGVQQVRYALAREDLAIPEGLEVPWADTLCKRSLEEGRTYTDDVAGVWGDSEAARALGIATYASMPVRGSAGALYGTLCAASSRRQPLREDAGRVLALFSRLVGYHLEREQLLQQLQQANQRLGEAALVDPVTGLPNRRALLESLERRLLRRGREGHDVLVAFIDLDGFKQINDTLGHQAGDRFLAAIARRLQQCHRGDDITARLGGDEFAVVASAAHGDGDAARALQRRLQDATIGRLELGDQSLDYRGASVGVVVATPDSHDPQAELARADAAMYEDKRRRKQLSPAPAPRG